MGGRTALNALQLHPSPSPTHVALPVHVFLRPSALPPNAQVWEADSGEGFTNIEPGDADINDVCIWPRSGLIMVGCDSGEAAFGI